MLMGSKDRDRSPRPQQQKQNNDSHMLATTKQFLIFLSLILAISAGIGYMVTQLRHRDISPVPPSGVEATPASGSPRRGLPEVEFEQATLIEIGETGEPIWELSAQVIEVAEDLRTTTAEKIELQFNFPDKRVWLTGDRLVFDNSSRDITLQGNVFATDNAGITIYTDELTWNANQRVLENDAEVRIERGGSVLTGKGLRYFPDDDQIEIRERVHLKIETENS
ncbi:MAG: LPS export ABC transporter periplasmic protein LptC [Candidatus Bipolaricaulia bacterium]